jgi:hypothetical protein
MCSETHLCGLRRSRKISKNKSALTKRGPNFQSPTVNPKTIEEFQTDLKSLAEHLRQFEGSENGPAPAVAPSANQFNKPTHASPSPSRQPSIAPTPMPSSYQSAFFKPAVIPETNLSAGAVALPTAVSVFENLDSKSRDVILSVCQRLNLSDPEQALRMLIILGAEKLKVLD